MDCKIDFQHQQTAHCESGVIASLLRHHNIDMSEPMAFGISSGLTFAYIPLIKLGGLPLIAYRMPPRSIIRGLTRRLGITMSYETFRSPEAGMLALDAHLEAGRAVGLQTSVYWLEYFPQDMRFHFNAHNLVVYGKQGNNYLISDPTFAEPQVCSRESLQRARFVKGALAPKGLIYYPKNIPAELDFDRAITKALRFNTGMMVKTHLPIVGISGIRFLSRKIRSFDQQSETARHHNKLFIGHMVRMQEEIGTGGAGFRFLYASFLQQAASKLNNKELDSLANQLTDCGDQWRKFALYSAKMCKDRMKLDYVKLADQLLRCADEEEAVFRKLRQAI
jgi:hypothetical protein